MKRMVLCLCAIMIMANGCWKTVYLGEYTPEGTNTDSSDGEDGTDSDDNDSDSGDEGEAGELPLLPKTLYVTGVEYPEGVDWQGDIGYDISGSTLFLMKDGVKIVELAVGYDECVSIDADMHRCIDGHLYTDFSTDDETVVMVDGKEAYRYEGREMIKSMCVKDNVIHTLCVPRDGSAGWKYRRDGEEVLSQSSGDIIGGLYEDEGDIVFTYVLNGAYYMFINNTSTSINFGFSPTEVFDVRRIGGVINHISTSNGIVAAMAADTVMVTFGTSDESDIRIYYDGKDRFYAGSAGGVAGVWREGEVSLQCSSPPVGFSLRGDSYICIIDDADGTMSICCDGETNYWQVGTELMYETCVATDGFDYTVGLINRTRDNAPALWQNGSITNYGFNGFLTHADYW